MKIRHLGLLILLGSVLHFSSPQDLHPGLSYEHRKTTDPLSIHILTVDPKRLDIRPERAGGQGTGRETVSSMARRTGALAAVNGGFFRIGGRYDGEPVGILKIEDHWFSDPALPRSALGWRKGGREVVMGRLTMSWHLTLGQRAYPVDGINRPRGAREAIVFTSPFGPSTLTEPGGTEIVIANSRVAEVRKAGDSAIPEDGYVYSAGSQMKLHLDGIRPNAKARLFHRFVPSLPATDLKKWRRSDHIVGGTPLLVHDGKVVADFTVERIQASFVGERHPRTAIGIRRDGTWILVVVDGRQPENSVGMTMAELAHFMHSLECRQALNLDGGGSTTLFLQNRVVNVPSDPLGERAVSDAILIFPRK